MTKSNDRKNYHVNKRWLATALIFTAPGFLAPNQTSIRNQAEPQQFPGELLATMPLPLHILGS
jgi:hypothetical protein